MSPLRFALLVALLVLAACRSEIVPQTPRVARGSGYELALTRTRNLGLADPSLGSQQMDVEVRAFPEGARVLSASLSEASQKPCEAGLPATRVYVKERSAPVPVPGQTLHLVFPQKTWLFALGGPSRLDVLLTDSRGLLKCASFPLIGEGPDLQWDAVSSWTLETPLTFEFLQKSVAGIYALGALGLEAGRWLGPVRFHIGGGGGTSECERSACPPMKSNNGNPHGATRETYYVPVTAGLGGTLFQVGPVALEAKLQYRVAWTAADSYHGLKRVLLHGPVLTPALTLTQPNPLAPGIAGGTRRGIGAGIQVPIGYVMSSRGVNTPSFGIGFSLLWPLR